MNNIFSADFLKDKFKVFIIFIPFFFQTTTIQAQHLQNIKLDEGLQVTNFEDDQQRIFQAKLPLLSYTSQPDHQPLHVSFERTLPFSPGIKGIVTFQNDSKDTIHLSNVVPFGISADRIYISGKGNHPLSRTHLFLPGRIPVNVIVPDNAWELGYGDVPLTDSLHICSLVRRNPSSLVKGQRKRFETILFPGGSVQYNFYADFYRGNWQEGLKEIFQKRYLYDVIHFDSTLYHREDLAWIKKSFVMHLIMAWDKQFDYANPFWLQSFFNKNRTLFGGDDVVGIWPSWPTLGLDARNQFDLYRDLPLGFKGLKILSDSLHDRGAKLFISYNPWDESTRFQDHLHGLSGLVRETQADGIILDTRGESSKALQQAADSVKAGVIMYSEGMAVPKNMQGILSGRVHNALYYPPMLNLNKLIKPDFSIFRVAELYKEPIRREFSLSLFNGYGVELNIFAPGDPAWAEDQYRYLGKISRILRENYTHFSAYGFTPLISTLCDSVWVNQWEGVEKTVYTVFSIIPQGRKDLLFKIFPDNQSHFVDVYHHQEIIPQEKNGAWYAPVQCDPFPAFELGTNNEGAVSCLVKFKNRLLTLLDNDELIVYPQGGDVLKVWAGDPDYAKEPLTLPIKSQHLFLSEWFGRYEGKIVIQLFENEILIDENIVYIPPGTPRLISKITPTAEALEIPPGMVRIPPGEFTFKTTHGDDFIPYPEFNQSRQYEMPSFFMDQYPVTNKGFEFFLKGSGYFPKDTVNFLKHWIGGKIPKGQENFPVIFVSWEDAKAYAEWAGKRLPTEIEWQYAAQTTSLNSWPWKQKKPIQRKEEVVTETLTVSSIQGIEKKYCNLGDGHLYAVGSYPKGRNPYGLFDLTGCVWQLTNDLYQNGSYQYIMMKGGSYYNPSSSWWYVQGGPRELHYRQYLLRVTPGFERNATVGFRCVKDTKQ